MVIRNRINATVVKSMAMRTIPITIKIKKKCINMVMRNKTNTKKKRNRTNTKKRKNSNIWEQMRTSACQRSFQLREIRMKN